MIPAYMHRLNAWQITAFPKRQKSNKWYKNSLLCVFRFVPASWWWWQWKERYNGHAVVQLCVCQARAGGSKRLEAKNQWCGLWLHPLQMEGGRKMREGRRERRFEQILPPTDGAGWPHQSCNTNQSQTRQLDSTCVCHTLSEKSHS